MPYSKHNFLHLPLAFFVMLLLVVNNNIYAQKSKPLSKKHLPAYTIFNTKGKPVPFKDIVAHIINTNTAVVLFGEQHNNPISHWLQYELLLALHQQKDSLLIVGGEMWEADNQLIIDEYLQQHIEENKLEAEVRLWPNYNTDYKPFFSYAAQHNLPFIATNIPRRYASKVYKQGLKSLNQLSDAAKQYLPPLPITVDMSLPGYANLLHMMGAGHTESNMQDSTALNFPHAQAVKDATMAYNISKHLLHKDQLFYHINGAYHSNNYEGIYWYINHYQPNTPIVTITTLSVPADAMYNISTEQKQLADFIILVNENMTKTH